MADSMMSFYAETGDVARTVGVGQVLPLPDSLL